MLLVLAAVAQAKAQELRLGEPQYGGTGCPDGTASVVLSPEETTLSILFDNYVVETGGLNKLNDRKNCNIAIPIHIPQGYSYSVVALDYRGYMSIPRGGSARLAVNYFLAGEGSENSVRTSATFTGPVERDYLKTDRLGVEAVVWSACGADTILRTNTTLALKTNSRGDEAMATVDSIDVKSGIVYHLQWKRCR